MAKSLLMTILLLSLWIHNNNSDVEAVRETNAVDVNYNVPKVRPARSAVPFFSGLIDIWNAIVNIHQLYLSQKNETDSALQQTYDILADGFTDTATKKPQVAVETSTDGPNGTTTTTTERYRISRKELGYILGRNYRGLQKLFRIELDDALNQSQYTIKEYKQESGNAVAQYTVPKAFPPKVSES